MTPLTEFLLARIADDELVATAAREHEYLSAARDASPLRWVRDAQGYGTVFVNSGRVLAECEAKRRIVAEHPAEWNDAWRVLHCPTCSDSSDTTWSEPTWPCNTLRALASVYADHPDYQQEWKP